MHFLRKTILRDPKCFCFFFHCQSPCQESDTSSYFPYFHCISFKFSILCLGNEYLIFSPWTCHRWAFEAQRHCIVFVTLWDIQEKKIKLLRRDRTWNGKQCVLAVYLFRGLLCFKRCGRTMFGGTRVVQCLHFWKWLSALMFVCVWNVFIVRMMLRSAEK